MRGVQSANDLCPLPHPSHDAFACFATQHDILQIELRLQRMRTSYEVSIPGKVDAVECLVRVVEGVEGCGRERSR